MLISALLFKFHTESVYLTHSTCVLWLTENLGLNSAVILKWDTVENKWVCEDYMVKVTVVGNYRTKKDCRCCGWLSFEHNSHSHLNQSSWDHKKCSGLDLLNLPHKEKVKDTRCSHEKLSSVPVSPFQIYVICPAAHGLGGVIRLERVEIGGLTYAAMEKSSPYWGGSSQWYRCFECHSHSWK